MALGLSDTTFSQLMDDLASVEAFHHTVTVMSLDTIKAIRHLRDAAGPGSNWAVIFLFEEVPKNHIMYVGLPTQEYDLRAINRLVMQGLRHPKDEFHKFEEGEVLFKEYR